MGAWFVVRPAMKQESRVLQKRSHVRIEAPERLRSASGEGIGRAPLRSLAIVGHGVMGELLVQRVLACGLLPAACVSISGRRSERNRELERRYGIGSSESNPRIVEGADLIILAVKPVTLPNVLGELRSHLRADQVVVSIVSGVPLRAVSAGLHHRAVARAMPNLPSAVGCGVTAWLGPHLDRDGRARVTALLGTLGRTVEVRSDRLMDAATAIAGAGPIYPLLLMESLVDSGVRIGLPHRLARELVFRMVLASTTAWRIGMRSTDLGATAHSSAHLRATVASAVDASVRRGRELYVERTRSRDASQVSRAIQNRAGPDGKQSPPEDRLSRSRSTSL
jgi:pyrroline-5-carboxylate reductase